jgi:hypothetical protein
MTFDLASWLEGRLDDTAQRCDKNVALRSLTGTPLAELNSLG